jgi:hypothetical protein
MIESNEDHKTRTTIARQHYIMSFRDKPTLLFQNSDIHIVCHSAERTRRSSFPTANDNKPCPSLIPFEPPLLKSASSLCHQKHSGVPPSGTGCLVDGYPTQSSFAEPTPVDWIDYSKTANGYSSIKREMSFPISTTHVRFKEKS